MSSKSITSGIVKSVTRFISNGDDASAPEPSLGNILDSTGTNRLIRPTTRPEVDNLIRVSTATTYDLTPA